MTIKEIILGLESIGKNGSLIELTDEQQQAINLACKKLRNSSTRQQIIDAIQLLAPLLTEVLVKR